MNCVELQQSLEQTADIGTAEQRDHLRTCPVCTALVEELCLIAVSAIDLREADEPSPRVWNSIEASLRREGLIRPQRMSRSLFPSMGSGWSWVRWMAPAAAALLIALGLYVRQHSHTQQLASNIIQPVVSDAAIAGLNDEDLLQEVSEQNPDLRQQYTDNLRRVNESIQDAKSTVDADPNDEEARRSLMEAYQQKAMLFELALDRSLP
jgi:hypothetical protein